MRIAFLTPVWKGTIGGGILMYSINLIEGLKNLGHSVDIYALHAAKRDLDGEVRLVESRGNRFALKALSHMLPEDYDAVLCGESRFTFPPAAAYALLRRVPVVYIVYTFPSKNELGPLGVRGYRAPFNLQKDGLFRVVFVTEQLRQHVAESFGVSEAERGSVVPAAAPPISRIIRDPAAVQEFRRAWGVRDEDWLVLGLGLTVLEGKAKGAALLILALSRMRLEGEPFKLMLTRKGRPFSWLRDLVHRCGLDQDVIFTDEVPDPMLALNACDLYTHMVVDEGLGVSLLEAMAAGKPIVATRRAGIPEALQDGVEGLLVEPSVDAIVVALRRMREDPQLRARLGEAARRRAAAMSWEAVTKKYESLLEGRSA